MTPQTTTARLTGADGTALGTVRVSHAGGVRWVGVDAAHGTDAPDLADALLAAYPGARVMTGDDALVQALVARGGSVQRRAHDYLYDLESTPPEWRAEPSPAGYTVTHVGDATELAPAREAAYPPGHPNHDGTISHAHELARIVSGEVMGPLVGTASFVARQGISPVGAVLVVDRQAFDDQPAMLWVIDVFIHPSHAGRGLGRTLLHRSLAGAAAAGHSLVGLVVSDGNPAHRLYESVGFRLLLSGTNVDLPANEPIT